MLGGVPFHRKARLLRSQMAFARESPQVAIPVPMVAAVGSQSFHGTC
jgi:hypothetical protein